MKDIFFAVKPSQSPKKKKEDEAPKWCWWKEPKRTDGTKWTFLQHNGPLFAPPYEPLPQNVRLGFMYFFDHAYCTHLPFIL